MRWNRGPLNVLSLHLLSFVDDILQSADSVDADLFFVYDSLSSSNFTRSLLFFFQKHLLIDAIGSRVENTWTTFINFCWVWLSIIFLMNSCCLIDPQMKIFGSTEATTESKARIFPCQNMVLNPERTHISFAATLYIFNISVELYCLPSRLCMAFIAKMCQIVAYKSRYVAAEAALVVNEGVTMLFFVALREAEAQLLRKTLLAA